jgi:hypothetical protein
MALNKRQAEFLSMIIPKVQRQSLLHGCKLYPSVTIAQAIHESGWGTSKKMVAANALFGVKVGKSAYKFGEAWHGAAYKTGTTEYYDGKTATKITDYFRQYDTIEDSVCDYMDMLCHCKRYQAALSRRTPRQSIEGIIAGNYATGPDYVNRIMTIIKQYNLTKYDIVRNGEYVNSLICPYAETKKTLRRGMRGDDVRYLQWLLHFKFGYTDVAVDGSFGPTTEKYVLAFQHHVGLEEDGVVGGNTWEMLKSDTEPRYFGQS